ncbi:T9SS type A sorting domain-containing protein [Flavobacterium sp. H122]|uniref:T9SS type A sorting domain-containing protein n=1 Tax=Flavobacterium sp. H122 TaxID=2529860 RepID=UPI00145A0AE2|nr:T9SS type A sorting domain-containing protein [Flavobacterium sp. H122]
MKKIFSLVFLLISSVQFAQTINATLDIDNCLNILPKAGTYTLDGQENGKNKYVLGTDLKIVWSDIFYRWELQEYYEDTWTTAFYNDKNSDLPPTICWLSDSCSGTLTLGGNDAIPVINTPTILMSSETANTVTYTVTFISELNNLSSSNFTLQTRGDIIANISSVTQTTNTNIWNVTIDWSGEGDIRLDLTNDLGCTPLISCGAVARSDYFNSYTAPLTLNAGDIAFTGYNSYNYVADPQFSADFSFVVLKNGGLPAGTKLFFTDSGYNNNTSSLSNIEGGFILNFNDAVNQYDNIRVTIPLLVSDPYIAYLPSGTATTNKVGFTMSISQDGDQIFVHQGTTRNPKFITGIQMNAEPTSELSTWDNYTSSGSKSALPSQLTNGVNAIMVVDGTEAPYTESDNASFNYSGKTISQINAATINDRNEWLKRNGSITNSNRCDLLVFNYATVLSSNNFELERKIAVYPNPANSILNINFNELIPKNATILDIHGRKLKSNKLSDANNALDITGIAKGVYILQIDTEEGVLKKQIIIE